MKSVAGCAAWLLLALLLAPAAARAQFIPVPLTPESYNCDAVVEKEAPPPLLPATSASMEAGTDNTGLSWYERGYNLNMLRTGLPQAGAIFQADFSSDHTYQMAPSYREPNALLLDARQPTGTLTLTLPRVCGALSMLSCSAVATVTLEFDIHHEDGTVQSGTFAPASWLDTIRPAWTAAARIDVRTFAFYQAGQLYGTLSATDVLLNNNTNPVTHIDFRRVSGSGRAAVFALSAAEGADPPFSPVAIHGYNQDVVVEASALHPAWLLSATATVEAGFENRRYTLYERGYVASLPDTGLPHPGEQLLPAGFPGSAFVLAPDYAANNAVTIDSSSRKAVLTPAAPVACAGLVLLTAAGHGPVTNTCAVAHADGTWETNSWVAPDYIDGDAPVYVADGRVDVATRIVDGLGQGRARLFAAFCGLSNARSPVTSVILEFGGQAGSVCTVLALSALPSGAARPVLSVQPGADGTLTITSTVPGVLESAASPDAPQNEWRVEGSIDTSVTLAPASNEPCRFYRARAN